MSGPGRMRLHDVDEPAPAKDTGTVRAPIDQGLGQVAVSAAGELTSVDLDERNMRTTRADRLAELILSAMVRAQDTAAARRHDAVRRQLRESLR